MSNSIITVEGLSKRYVIGHQRNKEDGFRHIIEDAVRAPLQWLRRRNERKQQEREEFWALKDVSFEVKRGDVLGVVGRNGSGKSTLLKILSRITEPTSGRISIEGRVASLLEVGTGFHPELTGRENIYLNGAILGMRRTEIRSKFDQIVEFSEVEKFLDTPVKRYSSGMYVRLAFAVAAHLEPEILIVDEVLAVGDASFQQKCMGKMKDVAGHGRTVIFVSHQMAAITNLCTSCVVLSKGTVAFHGASDIAVRTYLDGQSTTSEKRRLSAFRASWGKPYIISSTVMNLAGEPQTNFKLGDGLVVELRYEASGEISKLRRPVMGIVIQHSTLGATATVNMRMTGSVVENANQHGTIRCKIPSLDLVQGKYSIDVWLGDGPTDVDMLDGYLTITIEGGDIYGSGQMPFPNMGAMFLRPIWEIA